MHDHKNFLKWLGTSLSGHVCLAVVLVSFPLFGVLSSLNYSEGTLTVRWAVWIFFISCISDVVVGVLLWYTFSRPLIKRLTRRWHVEGDSHSVPLEPILGGGAGARGG